MLTKKEAEKLKKTDVIKIGDVEVDFSILGENTERTINVTYTQSEGEELWNSTVTLTLTLEENELTLDEKRERLIGFLGCSNYEEFKIALAGSVESYDAAIEEMGEESLLDNLILSFENEFGIEFPSWSLQELREIAAYMVNCSSYEEFITLIESLAGTTYEEVLTDSDCNIESVFLTKLINSLKSTLSFSNVNKLESLGIKVISVKTPYDTTLYTTNLGGNIQCTFIENGSYTFTIQSGSTQISETIKIDNIRNYDEQSPHTIKIDSSNISDVTTAYSIDDSEEYTTLSSTILSCNDSISFDFTDTDSSFYWMSYVIKDKEYYKYFNDETEWKKWCDNQGAYLYAWSYAQDGLTCRQYLLKLMILYNYSFTEITGINGDWADWMDEYWMPRWVGETIDEEEMLQKYPKSGIGVANFLDGNDDPKTLTFTKDTNIYVLTQQCLPTDTYIEVIVWDEEKKKKVRKRKKLKDITYEDELLVWDFDKGEFATAKPLWIMKTKVANRYNLLKFSDGSELKTIEQHRIFNKEKGKFTYPMTDETPIGTTTYTADGKEVKLISKKVIVKEIEFANIITNYHMNVFANNILTSCRFSNLYSIEDMKYVKDDREIRGIEEYNNIPEEYYYGLRLGEQNIEVNRGNDVAHANSIEEHIQKVYLNNAKKRAL